MSDGMDAKELRELSKCASRQVQQEPAVYTGCAPVSSLLETLLNEMGVAHRRVFGVVETNRKEKVGHSWIEVGDVVLETNPSQVLGLDYGVMAMAKDTWVSMTNPKESVHPCPEILQPTDAGRKFYQEQAKDIISCLRRL